MESWGRAHSITTSAVQASKDHSAADFKRGLPFATHDSLFTIEFVSGGGRHGVHVQNRSLVPTQFSSRNFPSGQLSEAKTSNRTNEYGVVPCSRSRRMLAARRHRPRCLSAIGARPVSVVAVVQHEEVHLIDPHHVRLKGLPYSRHRPSVGRVRLVGPFGDFPPYAWARAFSTTGQRSPSFFAAGV